MSDTWNLKLTVDIFYLQVCYQTLGIIKAGPRAGCWLELARANPHDFCIMLAACGLLVLVAAPANKCGKLGIMPDFMVPPCRDFHEFFHLLICNYFYLNGVIINVNLVNLWWKGGRQNESCVFCGECKILKTSIKFNSSFPVLGFLLITYTVFPIHAFIFL